MTEKGIPQAPAEVAKQCEVAASKVSRPTFDTYLKLAGALVTVGGLGLGVANYLATVQKDAETRRLEVRKEFLSRQLALYTEVVKLSSRLSLNPPLPHPPEAVAVVEPEVIRFWELYWGELALVEDKGVESAMVNMGRCLAHVSGGRAVLPRDTAVPATCSGCAKADLPHCSLELVHACRASLASSWGVTDWKY